MRTFFLLCTLCLFAAICAPNDTWASTYTIAINVSGRVSVRSHNQLEKGVPKVKVYLDWDVDNNPETYNHPVYANGATDYVYTDDDGYYSFIRQVESNVPANQITDTIHVFANAYNEAAMEENRQTGIFVDRFPIDVLGSTTTISASNANIDGEERLGMALRNLMRARMFCINELKFTPPRVTFRFDLTKTNSEYDWGDEIITFLKFVVPEAMYHEYGHFVMDKKGAFVSDYGGCSTHWWELVTNDACAWVEGWAQFYSAATHAYWYRKEQPARREDDESGEHYQFPDAGQLLLGQANASCEGVVASFLYNLWDPLTKHIPNNPGDNEDLGAPRGYPPHELLNQLPNAIRFIWVDEGWKGRYVRLKPYLEAYKNHGILPMVNRLYPITYDYHFKSINALYGELVNNGSRQMSATPTTLAITSTDPEHIRTLTWTDSTEETSFTYQPEVAGGSIIFTYNNRENGFRVWRRPVLDPTERDEDWDGRDGRLDPRYVEVEGYVPHHLPIGTVSYNDIATLAPGRYRYVVVAWNFKDITLDSSRVHSIPKASKIFVVRKNITIKKDGADDCAPATIIRPGTSLRLVASASGSADPTFQWIAANKPSYIALSGLTSDTLTITNNYQSGTPYGGFPLFSLRCVATDSTGADTSHPYYPAYTPLDTASSFVHARNALYYVIDSNRTRGLDFVTRPGEHVISVAPLGTKPVKDSTGYRVMLRGFASGSLSLGHVRLLAIDHPPGTVVPARRHAGSKSIAIRAAC